MFVSTDFSPIGAQARRGQSPQIFAYTTPDDLATVKADSYFDELRGDFSINDWIFVTTERDTTPAFAVIFIRNDGVGVGVDSAVVDGGGSGYTVGDILTLNYEVGDGTVLRDTKLRVTTEAAGVITGVEIIDPGLFGVVPTKLDQIPSSSSGGLGATFNLTVGNGLPVIVYSQEMMAS